MRRIFLAILILASTAFSQSLSTAEEVLAAMHAHYADNWYRTLTFDQESITHKPDGTSTSAIWHEALMLPGRLRIEFGDPSAGNGALFVNDHQYVYKDGKLASDKPRVHPLLVLGFDVYAQPVTKTVQQLKDLHIDLSALHEEKLQGRTMLVSGAKAGDLRSPQFWIDKERLYFVRLLQPDEKDPSATEDIRFEDYRQVKGGGWVAEHVIVYSNDKLVFEEKYSNVKVDPPLRDQLFDAKDFAAAGK
jgi:outer membrane lipoprotein-sorting protein